MLKNDFDTLEEKKSVLRDTTTILWTLAMPLRGTGSALVNIANI